MKTPADKLFPCPRLPLNFYSSQGILLLLLIFLFGTTLPLKGQEQGIQWMLLNDKSISDKFKEVTEKGGPELEAFQKSVSKAIKYNESLPGASILLGMGGGATLASGVFPVLIAAGASTGGAALVAAGAGAVIAGVPISLIYAGRGQMMDVWVANYTSGELEVLEYYFHQGQKMTLHCDKPAEPLGKRIPSANNPEKAYLGLFMFEKKFGLEGVIGAMRLRSKKDGTIFHLGFRMPYKTEATDDGVGNGCYCSGETVMKVVNGFNKGFKNESLEEFYEREVKAGLFDTQKLKGNISNKNSYAIGKSNYSLKCGVSGQFDQFPHFFFEIIETNYRVQPSGASYLGSREKVYKIGRFEDLGPKWNGTEAITSLDNHLFAVRGGHLWKTSSDCTSDDMGGNWGGTEAMTTLGNHFYAVQGDHLWKTDANGKYTDLGPRWGGTEAMTTLGNYIYAVQGGHLWKTDSRGKSTDLGPRWGGTEAMTTLGNYIYAVQGGHLWRTDANGKSTDLGPRWGGTKAMTSIGNYIYAVQGGHLWKTDAKGKSTDLGANWGGPVVLTRLGNFLYAVKGDRLWVAKMQ